mmetsp:Transcript_52590/g.112461  ORF Transcript_52590/g.112461 Transcript_52590/m.112461 type:complete len:326 (-) Transcript_52590:98-1075(-)
MSLPRGALRLTLWQLFLPFQSFTSSCIHSFANSAASLAATSSPTAAAFSADLLFAHSSALCSSAAAAASASFFFAHFSAHCSSASFAAAVSSSVSCASHSSSAAFSADASSSAFFAAPASSLTSTPIPLRFSQALISVSVVSPASLDSSLSPLLLSAPTSAPATPNFSQALIAAMPLSSTSPDCFPLASISFPLFNKARPESSRSMSSAPRHHTREFQFVERCSTYCNGRPSSLLLCSSPAAQAGTKAGASGLKTNTPPWSLPPQSKYFSEFVISCDFMTAVLLSRALLLEDLVGSLLKVPEPSVHIMAAQGRQRTGPASQGYRP